MVNARLTEDEYVTLAGAASMSGVSVSEYLRTKALAAARRTVR